MSEYNRKKYALWQLHGAWTAGHKTASHKFTKDEVAIIESAIRLANVHLKINQILTEFRSEWPLENCIVKYLSPDDLLTSELKGYEFIMDLLDTLLRVMLIEQQGICLTTASTMTAAPVDSAAPNDDLAQPQVNPDR